MAAYFEAHDLKGMANWMRIQAGEEQQHAMRIFDFINDRNGRVTLSASTPPRPSGSRPWRPSRTPTSTSRRSRHDQRLDEPGGVERDGAGHDFLEWFCREQVEEEANVQLIVSQLKLAGDSGLGLYMVDQQLGQRGGKMVYRSARVKPFHRKGDIHVATLVTKEAPDFTAKAVMPDNSFAELKLSSYRGKYVMLFFYPLDFTFVCPSEIIAFDAALAKFEKKNAQVLGSRWTRILRTWPGRTRRGNKAGSARSSTRWSPTSIRRSRRITAYCWKRHRPARACS